MPLPRNNGGLPSLDDLSSFDEEFENLETSPEDLEDITDDNLDNGYDSENTYDLEENEFEQIEDYQEEEIEEDETFDPIEDLPDPYAIKPSNNTLDEDVEDDREDNSNIKNKLSGFFKKDKREKPKKDKPKKKIKTSGNENIKKAGIIAGGIIFFIIAMFIFLHILGGSNIGTKSNNKPSETATKSGLSITNRYIQDGTYYMEISSNNDINIEYIDSAFINDSTLVKCTTFNPYVDKGDNVVEFEDCDYALSDEKVEQYIDNVKLVETEEE